MKELIEILLEQDTSKPDPEQIQFESPESEKWTLLPDGRYDVDGDVDLSNQHLTTLPYRFRNVSGDFDCSYNKLTSLEGAPREVGGDFDCSDNKLTSLAGAPVEVGGKVFSEGNLIR